MKNWKTTLSGIATILTALGGALHAYSTGTLDANTIAAVIAALTTGIGLLLAHDANPTDPPKNITPLILLMIIATGSLALQACDSFERQSFQTLSASHAVIEQARADYISEAIPRTRDTKAAIEEASAVQNLASEALLNYEIAVKAKSPDIASKRAVVVELLSRLPALVARIKAVAVKAMNARDHPALYLAA